MEWAFHPSYVLSLSSDDDVRNGYAVLLFNSPPLIVACHADNLEYHDYLVEPINQNASFGQEITRGENSENRGRIGKL